MGHEDGFGNEEGAGEETPLVCEEDEERLLDAVPSQPDDGSCLPVSTRTQNYFGAQTARASLAALFPLPR